MNDNIKEESIHSQDDLAIRFDCWVKRTLKNLIKTQIRSAERQRKKWQAEIPVERPEEYLRNQITDPSAVLDCEEILLGETVVKITNEKLAIMLKQLDCREREIVELCVLLNMPIKDAARVLNLNPRTVSNYKSRIMKGFRTFMEERK